MQENRIRDRIRQMLETGALPCDEAEKIWAGRGNGSHCVACAEPISASEVEFEVDIHSGLTLRLHRSCHALWREECDALAGQH